MLFQERYGSLTRAAGCLLVALLAVSFIGAPPAAAQVLDANGYVTSNNFLALGPFPNPFGCTTGDQILCNHVAPSWIQCEYPEEGDEVTFDEALACSTGYIGPLGPSNLPQWRLFNDGSDDCNNDMDADAGGDISDQVTFLCTYVENDSADDVTVQLCLHSDDGVQVWLDDQLVTSIDRCAGWGDCAAGNCLYTEEVVLTEGIHRFIVGVWERAGGWGGSLGFLDESGNPIDELGETDLDFLGVDGQGFSLPCVPPPGRLVTKASEPDACPPGDEGPVSVVITQDAEPAGETVTVTETVTFPAGTDITIDASANGGVVTDIISADDGIDPATGGALEFFVLGPITNIGGAAPGLDAIRQEYLAIPDEDVDTLDEGDTVNDVDGIEQTVRRIAVNNGDALDFNQVGGAGDNIMHYAWTKLTLTAPTDVIIGVNADDSVQVLANGDEVTIADHDGGFGGVGTMEWSGLVSLPAGDHTILTKTFEGGGGHGVRLLFYRLPAGGIGPGGIDCGSATEILPGQTGVGATPGADIGLDCDPQLSPAHYYVVEGTGETMRAETCNPVFLYDTYLAVFDTTCDALGCLASNDDTCGRQSVVEWASVAGVDYYIRVYGWDAREGVYFLRVSDTDTPAEAPLVATPLTGSGVCASPDGGCDTEALTVTGKTITWNVQRSVLQGAGVSYEIDVSQGTLAFDGDVDGASILGNASVTLNPPINNFGPFAEPPFLNAHGIGNPPCTTIDAISPAPLGDIALTGAGNDIWNAADQCIYAYSEQTGDFRAEVTITDRLMGSNPWAKHGIMARANCSAGSPYAYMADQQDAALASGNGTNIQWRLSQDIGAAYGGNRAGHGDTLRLERSGSLFSGAYIDSLTGEWVEVGSVDIPDMPDTIQLGLAVTSHDACNPVTVTFSDWEVTTEFEVAPTNVTCTGQPNGELAIAWEMGGLSLSDFIITANGTEVGTVGPAIRGFTVAAAQVPDGVLDVCVTNDEGSGCCGFFKGNELNINCGGLRLDDGLGTGIGDGRVWEEDSAASPSPFLVIGPNRADFSAGLTPPPPWDPMNISLVTDFGFTDEFLSRNMFATETWNDGPVQYTITTTPGCYDVTLFFAEGCCAAGCEDLPDPQDSTAGDCRVFDVYVNGELKEDQFSQHVEAQRGIGGILPNADWGVGIATGPYEVSGDVIDILIEDLGAGGVPQNASIKGISIVKVSDDPANCGGGGGPEFVRGDADGLGGAPNITDGIYILNFLFLGGPPPPCDDSADADDTGVVNITDGIYVLNFLFLGGPPPPAPYPACGEDATNDALDCASFPSC